MTILKMKLSLAVVASTLAVAQSFMVAPTSTTSSTQLSAAMDRRDAFKSIAVGSAGVAASLVVAPGAAFAEYTPKVDDVKQIAILGNSLDKLAEKLANPDTLEAGLEGVRLFNKDPDFYPGYAANFVRKLVKKGADSDPRVGYVKQACTLIGSIETVAAGGGALMDKAAVDESISRVRKAQTLLAKFLAESGVQDERIAAYIAKHP